MNENDLQFRIFVVDDEPNIASTTAKILQIAGFECFSFSDPLVLIEQCKTVAPDLVISDIIMPQMDGFDLAKRLSELHPQCRILLFTGRAGVDDLRELALELGHDIEVLSKPIQPDLMIAKVRSIADIEAKAARTRV